jgi:hypothetical protein
LGNRRIRKNKYPVYTHKTMEKRGAKIGKLTKREPIWIKPLVYFYSFFFGAVNY